MELSASSKQHIGAICKQFQETAPYRPLFPGTVRRSLDSARLEITQTLQTYQTQYLYRWAEIRSNYLLFYDPL
jgi:hypothetical protein